MLVHYCALPCQKKHWPKHKLICGKSQEELAKIEENKRELRIYQAAERILGNIIIMAAHNRCTVVVSLNLTIEEFMINSLQFAELSCGEADELNSSRVNVRFRMINYSRDIAFPVSKVWSDVVKNNEHPGASSSVMFEINS